MNKSIILLTTVLTLACSNEVNLEKARKEITDLLQQERKAHFDRNMELFISEFADSMISVNKGIVSIPTREQHRQRIGKYFGSVEFIKWDDLVEPIIRFSEDGSLAYAVIQKLVILSYPDTLGKKFIDTTNYAWVSIYRKQNGEWKVECNASTNSPIP